MFDIHGITSENAAAQITHCKATNGLASSNVSLIAPHSEQSLVPFFSSRPHFMQNIVKFPFLLLTALTEAYHCSAAPDLDYGSFICILFGVRIDIPTPNNVIPNKTKVTETVFMVTLYCFYAFCFIIALFYTPLSPKTRIRVLRYFLLNFRCALCYTTVETFLHERHSL